MKRRSLASRVRAKAREPRPMLLFAIACLLLTPAHAQPTRIASLDFCADQYVLRLADRDQIAAISRYAEGEDSYERTRAAGIAQIRPTLEEMAPLRPDLVVRTFGGGPQIEQALARRHVSIVNVGWIETIGDVIDAVRRVSAALGQSARGERFARALEIRRRALAVRRIPGVRALYLTPGGVTAGRGTMVDEIFREAGVENIEQGRGWRPAPLERLVRDRPLRLVLSFFDFAATRQDAWSAARHPLMRRILAETPSVTWPAAWTACAHWGALDAAEALQQAVNATSR